MITADLITQVLTQMVNKGELAFGCNNVKKFDLISWNELSSGELICNCRYWDSDKLHSILGGSHVDWIGKMNYKSVILDLGQLTLEIRNNKLQELGI